MLHSIDMIFHSMKMNGPCDSCPRKLTVTEKLFYESYIYHHSRVANCLDHPCNIHNGTLMGNCQLIMNCQLPIDHEPSLLYIG